MKKITFRFIDNNRQEVNNLIEELWFSTNMVIHGEIIDMTKADGIVAYDDSQIVGLITYRFIDNLCEILSLNSLISKQGIGTKLLERVIEIAKNNNCGKISLTTTNDNISAIRFYQKRGFRIVKINFNSIEEARKLKPSIPLIGDNGIPLKHEIDFEMDIDRL